MGGHVLRLPSRYIQVIEEINAKEKISYDELEYFFEPVMTQAALWEQYAIIRMMHNKDWSSAEIAFDELLPLMDVEFVRNDQLTVIPFPFKYLREYQKL